MLARPKPNTASVRRVRSGVSGQSGCLSIAARISDSFERISAADERQSRQCLQDRNQTWRVSKALDQACQVSLAVFPLLRASATALSGFLQLTSGNPDNACKTETKHGECRRL